MTGWRQAVPNIITCLAGLCIAQPGLAGDRTATVALAERLTIEAESLAALGITPTAVATVLDRLDANDQARPQLRAFEVQIAEANTAIAEIQRQIASGEDASELASEYTAAVQSRDEAVAGVRAARAALLTAVLGGLADAGNIDKVAADEPAVSVLPAPLRLAADDAIEGRTIGRALALEYKAQATATSLPYHVAQILSAARGEQGVSTAQLAVDMYAAPIQAAIEAWVQVEP